ncbi:hypothetical protein ACFV2U_22355 [Streptomyces sp. NPDC059697]|uniref:hypothetical protein n=1 Tax=Streptomyces sp. NPDC059697 TaxID=3346912 RepID=UPI00367DF9CB
MLGRIDAIDADIAAPDARIDAEVRALEAGVPFAWVVVDEVYGQGTALRGWLEVGSIAYVMAVPRLFRCGLCQQNARTLAAILPREAFVTRSTGPGAYGRRE